MAIATETSAAQFTNIVANTPLNNNYPLFAEDEVEVVYGSQALKAVLNTDFTVQLSEPNYNSFTVTPLAALLTKINALIASPPTDEAETNYVVVRRKLDNTTSATPDIVKETPFLSKEIDRMHMKLIQLQERVNRALTVPSNLIGTPLTDYMMGVPVEGKAPVWRGDKLVPEIDAANIAGAEEFASEAAASLLAAQNLLDDMNDILADMEALALLLPLNNYTATTNPTVNDDLNDGYKAGSEWFNTSTGDKFQCTSATVGAAVWVEVSGLAAGDLGSMAFEEASDYLLAADFDVQSIRQIPQNSKSADYTCVLSDGGKHLFHPSSDGSSRVFTIPANASVAYPIGTAITFVNQNGAGGISIAITTDTMRLAGDGTTGTRTLAANGIATALKVTATEWIISGTGLT